MDQQVVTKFTDHGAIGALAVLFLGLFLWMFKMMFNRLLQHLDRSEGFMTAQVDTMRELTAANKATHEFHSEVRDGLRDLEAEIRRGRENSEKLRSVRST
jgi:multidrug efflux pump subunit AcrB